MWEEVVTLATAHDVAAELRRRLPGLPTKKLHKLLYYVQGWHLAWIRTPVFGEEIEAWAMGPVVADLWADEKHDRPRPALGQLAETHLQTIDFVVGRYGQMTGKALETKTHDEAPWIEARASDVNELRSGNRVITADALASWFDSQPEVAEHNAAVGRLRTRADVYSFRSDVGSSTEAAVARALAGERVIQPRPR